MIRTDLRSGAECKRHMTLHTALTCDIEAVQIKHIRAYGPCGKCCILDPAVGLELNMSGPDPSCNRMQVYEIPRTRMQSAEGLAISERLRVRFSVRLMTG